MTAAPGPLAEGPETAPDFPAPTVDEVLALLGSALLFEALREAQLDRQLFLGFRPDPKLFSRPVIRTRLESILSNPRFLEAAATRWIRAGAPLLTELAALDPTNPEPGLQALVDRLGEGVVSLALRLQPDAGLRSLAARLPPPDPFRPSPPALNAAPSTQDGGPIAASGPKMAAQEALPSALLAAIAPSEEKGPAAAPVREKQLQLTGVRPQLQDQRREIDHLRKENDHLRKTQTDLRSSLNEWKRRAERAEAQFQTTRRQVERLQKAVEEAARRAGAAEKAVKQLAQADKSGPAEASLPGSSLETVTRPASAPKPSRPAAVDRGVSRSAPSRPAGEILDRLMQQEQYSAVTEYARQWLQLESASEEARRYLLDALTKSGRCDEAARLHYDAAQRAVAEKDHARALHSLCQSVQAAPESADAGWRMEKLLQTADTTVHADIEAVAQMYAALKREAPGAAREFEALARRQKRSLWRRLPAAMPASAVRPRLEWPAPEGAETISVSGLGAALTSNDEQRVDAFRRWAARQEGETRRAVLELVDGVNIILSGARRVLTGPTSPALVDGSNAAWASGPRGGRSAAPDLENIRAVRAALYRAGYFPVWIFADANLPHLIEPTGQHELERLHRWILRGEITLVQAGTNADETLVLEAIRRRCPIVTNDLLRDVDPDGRCQRIGFAIGPGGAELILPAP